MWPGEVEIEMLSTWKRGSGGGPFIGADNTMTDLEYVENSTGIQIPSQICLKASIQFKLDLKKKKKDNGQLRGTQLDFIVNLSIWGIFFFVLLVEHT